MSSFGIPIEKPKIVLRGLFNSHSHLRGVLPEDQALLPHAAKIQEGLFDWTLAMPNLDSPVWTGELSLRYLEDINRFAPNLRVVQVIYLTPKTTPQTIREAHRQGVKAVKLMFVGTTTGSQNGIEIRRIREFYPVFAEMDKCGIILCCHIEDPEVLPLRQREGAGLRVFRELVEAFPTLRFVFEHISSKLAIECVRGYPNVWMGITPHHLWLTENDVEGIGDYLCMPVIKSPEDREAVREVYASSHPRVICGPDDAPHKIRNKRLMKPGKRPSFGIWCAEVALEIYSRVLEERNALHRLPDRIWNIGAALYDLKEPDHSYELVGKSFQIRVEEDPDLPQPLLAGEYCHHQVERIAKVQS